MTAVDKHSSVTRSCKKTTYAFRRSPVRPGACPAIGQGLHALRLIAATCATLQAFSVVGILADNSPYRMEVRFSGYDKSDVLTNFPALIVFDEQIHGFEYDQFASTSGMDVRFYDLSTSNLLSHEIDTWNTNGKSCVWVKIPALSKDTRIMARWGAATDNFAPAFTTNGSVWSEGYEAVLHLGDPALFDYSRNGFDGDDFGSAPAAGAIGDSRAFDKADNDYIDCGPGLDFSNRSFTVSAWARRGLTGPTAEGYIVSHGFTGPPDRRGLHFGFRGGGEADLFAFGFWGDDLNAATPDTNTNDWRLWTATYNTATKQQRLYMDGVLIQQRTAVDHYQGPASANLRIGSRFDNVAFDGAIDEVRISSVERSSNWIWATHVAVASNSTFLSFGFVDNGPPPFIANTGEATDIASQSARAWGTLSTTGQAATTVTVYYGPTDGGTNKAAWQQWVNLGEQHEGLLSATLTGLDEQGLYFYRFHATNQFGEHWASNSTSLTTSSKRLVPENYTHRMEIRLDGYTKDEALTNFPLLVSLHQGLQGFRYGDFASPTGGDLRFADADEVTELPYEMDQWNPSGTSHVWVTVPRLTSNASVFAYWGRPGATNPPAYTTNGAAWNADFRTVLHLHTNNTPGTFLDATSYRLNGTNVGSFDDTGIIGRCRDFNHASGHRIQTGSGLDISNKSFSISVWSKRFTTTSADYLVSHGTSGVSSIGLHFGFIGSSTVRFSFWADDLDAASPAIGDTTDWHLWTATFNAETKRQAIYCDGVEIASRITFNPYLGSTSAPLRIAVAHTDPSTYYDGRIDEVRIAAATHSSNWIWACWSNQKSNRSFATYLPVQKPWNSTPKLNPSDYSHRMKMHVAGYARSEPLTNFPLLIEFGPLLTNFSYASFASTQGGDLRFIDAGDGRELRYEVEQWNTSGTSHVWVQVPMLTNGSLVIAHWGRPRTAAPPQAGLKLWLRADSGVQTNASGEVLQWLDQSGQGNHVASTNASSRPAVISGAIEFDGDDFLIKSTPVLPAGSKPRTLLLVARSAVTTGDQYPFAYGGASYNQSFGLDAGDSVRIVGFGNDHEAGFTATTNTRLYAIRFDGSTLDPAVDGTAGVSSHRPFATSTSNLFIGCFTDGAHYFTGDISEVLVYDRALSLTELHEAGYYLQDKYGLSTIFTDGPYYTVDGSTWDATHEYVLHLNDGFRDATHANRPVAGYGTYGIEARVANGRQFQKSFADHAHSQPGLDVSNRSFAISAWIRRSTTGADGDGFILSHGESGIPNRGLHFGFRGGAEADTMTFAFWADDLNVHDPAFADTGWHLWTATFDATSRVQSIYRNGTLVATRIANDTYRGSTSTVLRIGELLGSSYLDGAMDELRISSVPRSSNWIWACWYNQMNNRSFLNYLPAGFVDQDDDGMPDAWEIRYFGNATNAHPQAHADNDDQANLDEYIADTDPRDGDSRFSVENILAGNFYAVYFNASTGRVYSLLSTSNLQNQVWHPVQNQIDIPGFGANSFLIDSNAAERSIYRVIVELPP